MVSGQWSEEAVYSLAAAGTRLSYDIRGYRDRSGVDLAGHSHKRRSRPYSRQPRGERKPRRLSRAEYIRRLLEREHPSVQYAVTVDSLRRFRAIFSDLEDPGVISSAWS